MSPPRHFFLQPSLRDPAYVCGGWQIFNRAAALAGRLRDVEVLTYRHREEGVRYLDDVPAAELREAAVWIYWHSHVTELAERLGGHPRVILYAMNTDYGRLHGQETPADWPLVGLSRFLVAAWAEQDPWRWIGYLGPTLDPRARNEGHDRDVDVVAHVRKQAPYVREELLPALERSGLRVEVLRSWIEPEAFFELLNRSKVYLYWVHRQIGGLWVHEGFGMQPLEAIACGATPVANPYGGMADYLEPPINSRKIGVHDLDFDVAQIRDAVARHDGHNPDEERLREAYSEAAFLARFPALERELLFFWERRPATQPHRFQRMPPRPPLVRHLYESAYRFTRLRWKHWRGIRPK